MKKLRFNVWYEYIGTTEIPFPEEIDEDDFDAIVNYVEDHFDDAPEPEEVHFWERCPFDREQLIEIVNTEDES